MIVKPVGDCLFAFRLFHRRTNAVRLSGQACLANGLDSAKLRVAQPGHSQGMRRRLGFFKPVFKQRGAALNG